MFNLEVLIKELLGLLNKLGKQGFHYNFYPRKKPYSCVNKILLKFNLIMIFLLVKECKFKSLDFR